MKINKYSFISVLIFTMLSLSPIIYAEVRIDMPNTLTEIVPYKATLIVNEPSLQKYTKSIRYTCHNCDLIIKSEDQLKDGSFEIDLKGRDRIEFYIVGNLDRKKSDATGTISSLELRFDTNNTLLHEDYPDLQFFAGKGAEYTKYFGVIKSKRDYQLPSLPSDTQNKFEYDDFFGSYSFGDKQKEENNFKPIPMLLGFRFEGQSSSCFPKEDGYDFDYGCYAANFPDEVIEKGERDDGSKIYPLSLWGGKGYYSIWDKVSSIKNITDDNGDFLYAIGTVELGFNFAVYNPSINQIFTGSCTKKADVKEGDQDSFVNQAIEDCKSVLDTYKRVPIGSAPSVPKDEFKYYLPEREQAKPTIEYEKVCTSDLECNEGEACSACGECKKEKNIYPSSKAEVEFKLSNKFSSKSIANTIHNRILATTNIETEFTVDGKSVDYCELSYPGLNDYEFVAEMKNEDSYAGFIFGWVLDDRRKEDRRQIDFSEGNLEFSSLISPKDRKKIIGVTGDISENIEFRVEKAGKKIISTEEKVNLKAIQMDIQFSSNSKVVQQSSNKLIKYEVKDDNAKNIFIKGSLIGPGEIDDGKYKGVKFYANLKPGETQKLMYYSPKLGNFDLSSEIASLSMTNLQYEAGKQIVEDAVVAYGAQGAQGLEDAYSNGAKMNNAGMKALREYFKRNPGKYNPQKALDYMRKFRTEYNDAQIKDMLGKSYKLYMGTYGLSKIPKGTVDMRDDMKDAASVETVPDKKTTTENVAEYSIVGIDILQTGVGILTFLPNKIPVLGKMSAAAQTAFSAATNIWKANLKYLAKSEKIDRAEELTIPIIILITGEDESGWQQTKGYMLKVAYHEI